MENTEAPIPRGTMNQEDEVEGLSRGSVDGVPVQNQYSNIIAQGHSRSIFGNVYGNVYMSQSSHSEAEEAQKIESLLKHLAYPEMEQRFKEIHNTGDETYQRAFQGSNTLISRWLIEGNGIFWVSGKAGSGKSTFMKFISGHAKAENLLRNWCRDRVLLKLHHYFWYADTLSPLQRNLEGLLRNLLFQALSSIPGATHKAFAKRWKESAATMFGAWTLEELRAGLQSVFTESNTKFAIFIDALDECYPHTEHGKLLRTIQGLHHSENVKICVSCRPWKPFLSHFVSSAQHIYLHELNRHDIVKFTIEQFEEAQMDAGEDFGLYVSSDSSAAYSTTTNDSVTYRVYHDGYINPSPLSVEACNLVDLIADRAEGVFLWVYLLMRDLRDEICAGSSIVELITYVDDVPQDLLAFFTLSIRNRIGWRNERQVAKALSVAAVLAKAENDNHAQHLSFLNFWHLRSKLGLDERDFAERLDIVHVKDEELRKMLQRTRSLLGEICKDLIYIQRDTDQYKGWDLANVRIQFLHRTVYDYLLDEETQTWMNNHIPAHFHDPDFVVRLTIARSKFVPIEHGYAILNLRQQANLAVCLFRNPSLRHNEGHKDIFAYRTWLTSGFEMLAEIEVIVLHYLRLDGLRTLFDMALDQSTGNKWSVLALCSALASHGYTQYLVEVSQRFPSMWWASRQGNIMSECLSALFLEERCEKVFGAIKILLELGLNCTTKEWLDYILLWWELSHDQEMQTSSAPLYWDSSKSLRLWQTAELLLQHGAHSGGRLCIEHRKVLADKTLQQCCKAPFTECNVQDSLTILAQLAPVEPVRQQRLVLSDVTSSASEGDFDAQRRRTRSKQYRRGREVLLKTLSRDPDFDPELFERQYIHWVCAHEGFTGIDIQLENRSLRSEMRERLWSDHENYDLRHDIICSRCGIKILRSGLDRWLCVSCLTVEYCGLCVKLVLAQHPGHLQMIERAPFAFSVRDKWTTETLRNHARTQNLSLDDARTMLLSDQESARLRQPLPSAGDFSHWLFIDKGHLPAVTFAGSQHKKKIHSYSQIRQGHKTMRIFQSNAQSQTEPSTGTTLPFH